VRACTQFRPFSYTENIGPQEETLIHSSIEIGSSSAECMWYILLLPGRGFGTPIIVSCPMHDRWGFLSDYWVWLTYTKSFVASLVWFFVCLVCVVALRTYINCQLSFHKLHESEICL
jgi:hypothetical protein